MFSISSLMRLTKTIGFLLFRKIFLGYILFVSIIISYQIYLEYNFAKKLVLKELVSSESSFKHVLARSVWHFDENKINSQVEAIIKAQTITGVLITTPLDEIISIKGIVPKGILEDKKYVFSSENINITQTKEKLISHDFKLIDEQNSPNESLGTVTFYIKDSLVLQIAQESISLLLLQAFLSAVILWAFFTYFANKHLTIPLTNLIKAAKELGEKKYNKVEISFNTERMHELNTLADTFNTMSKDIDKAFTEMKELHKLQEEQKRELEEANRYKNDFLANMSHELKTPLNSINVISSVMMKNRKNLLNEEQVKNLSIINNCGNDLLYLINDVLDISKLEAGEVVLDMKQLDFAKLMHGIKDMFEPQTKEKNIKLVFEYDETIGDIYSDKNRINQIVKNLLSNAIKFVNEGIVEFIVTNEKENVKIVVKDNGIGIEKNKLEHIFDRFKQADGSTTRKYGGTGLGLAICKELLALLDGEIKVESTVNVGTAFTVIIPKNKNQVIEKQEEEKITEILTSKIEEKETSSNNKTVLLYNNDPINFLSLSIDIKKEFELQSTKTVDEFLDSCKNNSYGSYIIDISDLLFDKLSDVLEQLPSNTIVVYDEEPEELKGFKFTKIKKPFDKEEVISSIKQK